MWVLSGGSRLELLKPSHFIFSQNQFRTNQDLFRNLHVYLHLENYCAYANQKVEQIVQNCIIKYKVGLTKHQNVLSFALQVISSQTICNILYDKWVNDP